MPPGRRFVDSRSVGEEDFPHGGHGVPPRTRLSSSAFMESRLLWRGGVRPAPQPLDSGTGALSITQAALASLRIAINLSGASLNEPFVMPGGSPAASTSSFSVGSA